MSVPETGHAALMNATYRRQRRVYDLTRKYFLFGRDRLVAGLRPPESGHLLEIACGTGRNLDLIDRRWPGRKLYGLDISSEMLVSARQRLGRRAVLAEADACDFDPASLYGTDAFDRIVISYAVSMIPDWQRALEHSGQKLAPGGSLHVVDFGDLSGWPPPARLGLNRWLERFHVAPRLALGPVLDAIAVRMGARAATETIMGGYAVLGRIERADPALMRAAG